MMQSTSSHQAKEGGAFFVKKAAISTFFLTLFVDNDSFDSLIITPKLFRCDSGHVQRHKQHLKNVLPQSIPKCGITILDTDGPP